jgi:hypothetical protein
MAGTAQLRSLGQRQVKTCLPDQLTLLTRAVLARPDDPRRVRLHSGDGSPGIRVAAGRWQVVSFDALYPVTVTWSSKLGKDAHGAIAMTAQNGKPLSSDILDSIKSAQTDTALPGHEVDLHDGTWILLVINWPAVVTIKGQPPLIPSQRTSHLEITDQGYSYPEPTEKDHENAVRKYLGKVKGERDGERAELRRLALAYRYRDEIRKIRSANEITDSQVQQLFGFGLANVKTELRKKIWGSKPGRDDRDSALIRYLLDHQIIGLADVVAADRWITRYRPRS